MTNVANSGFTRAIRRRPAPTSVQQAAPICSVTRTTATTDQFAGAGRKANRMDNDREYTPEPVVVSAVLSTFAPIDAVPPGEDEKANISVATDWQELGAIAEYAELAGSMANLPRGYMAELFGRAAAGGEQLGLAFTAVRDAEAWLGFAPTETQRVRRDIGGRALAEMSGLWSVSTGHALVNVVARVVRAHSAASVMDKRFKWAGPPVPFVQDRNSHLSINVDTAKQLVRGARATSESALVDLVQPVRALVDQPEWNAMSSRRDVGYHRWRPQSVAGGAATFNPWVDEGNGSHSMSFGASSGHVPPSLEKIVVEARAGHTALTTAMRAVFDLLPTALDSVGVRILTSDRSNGAN